MLKVALTGGIATGKSHVLECFDRRGVPTIDADVLARQVIEPGSAGWGALIHRFGTGVIGPDGRLQRRRLAAIVFADPAARRDLEAIIHPAVYAAIERWIESIAAGGAQPLVVADIPLLYETRRDRDFDRVVVTTCPEAIQIERLRRRDGTSEAEARQRLAAQWPLAEKAARADFVIDTSGAFAETERQAEEVLETLRAEAEARLRK
jgi:dephospho-CoA kinase